MDYDERFYYAQDYKLFKDLIKQNFKFKVISSPLYYLNTINNISSNKKRNNIIMQVVSEIIKYQMKI